MWRVKLHEHENEKLNKNSIKGYYLFYTKVQAIQAINF